MPKNQYNSFFMSQNSPDNPFGPNYMKLPYMAKVQYKYNKMKRFVNFNQVDTKHKQYEEGKFLGTLLLGITSGFYIAALIRRISLKLNHSQLVWQHYGHLVFGLSVSMSTTYSYFQAHERYNIQVCKYFLDRYLSQAIENGFQNYQISK